MLKMSLLLDICLGRDFIFPERKMLSQIPSLALEVYRRFNSKAMSMLKGQECLPLVKGTWRFTSCSKQMGDPARCHGLE